MLRLLRSSTFFTLGLLASVVAVCVFVWSVWFVSREIDELRRTELTFDSTAQELLATIGFDGMIHDFKNCVIRAAEPDYCAAAERGARTGLALLDALRDLAADLELDADFDALEDAIETYGSNAARVAAAHEAGRPIPEIDASVRYDDAPAAGQIQQTIALATASVATEINAIRRRFVAQTVTGMVTLIILASWFALTARREMRQTRMREARLDAAFAAVSGGLAGLDRQGRIVFLNPPARALLHLPAAPTPLPWPEEVRLDLPGTGDGTSDATDPVRAVLEGTEIRGELRRLSVDRAGAGPDRFVRLSASLVDLPSVDMCAVIYLDDVTDQYRYQQQIERNSRLDALGQLTGGLAHDFNNLLATILYAVDISLREPQTDLARRMLRRAIASVTRGRDITARLLAFARRQPGTAEVVRVADLFREFETLARPAIAADVALTFETEDPDLLLICDEPQLENALLNLVLNASDAIREGGRGSRIKISARGVTTDNMRLHSRQPGPEPGPGATYRYVEISVADDGPGMSEEVRRRATDPFFTTRGQSRGTGLGLAMVYGFVKQSDGEMQIYSDPGRGTTIRLILPRATTEGGREPPVDLPPTPAGGGETVLLVEDEPELLAVMEMMIEGFGYRVTTAATGAEAWQRIEAGEDFDILLSDVVMPGGLDGLALAGKLREARPGTPVILMSGYADSAATGADGEEFDMVQKPCMPEELSAHLQRARARLSQTGS